MTEQELLQIRDLAEAGKVQFKERALDRYDIACEMVAFSNSRGGQLIIGINDKTGSINALSYTELQETTNLLANIATENVIPNVLIEVENTSVEGGGVVIANIPEGKNKPYHDNKGIIWVKNGTDKRKVFDNFELAEMMSDCGSFDADSAVVQNASIDDLDADTIKLYLLNRFSPVFRGKGIDELNKKDYSLDEMSGMIINGISIDKLLRNLRFIRPDGKLTVAAMLLFGKYTQRWLPVMTAKCVSFFGNSVSGTSFRDKMHDMEIEGNLLHQFRSIMNFFTRNLRKVQVSRQFNSLGELEIPYESLTEYVVNALVHRSLNIRAAIRIFIFDNRVEIHSPGALPNGLTVEDIINGTSMPRNMFLFTNANYLLPYTGVGSGVCRAIEYDKNVTFSNDEQRQEFCVTIQRDEPKVLLQYPTENEYEDTNGNMVCEQVSVFNRQKCEQPPTKSDQPLLSDSQKCEQPPTKSDQPHFIISKKQQDIRNFCSVPRTAKEIIDRLGLSSSYNNRKRYIYDLVKAGILERTIPDNPNDPDQKYRRKRQL